MITISNASPSFKTGSLVKLNKRFGHDLKVWICGYNTDTEKWFPKLVTNGSFDESIMTVTNKMTGLYITDYVTDGSTLNAPNNAAGVILFNEQYVEMLHHELELVL